MNEPILPREEGYEWIDDLVDMLIERSAPRIIETEDLQDTNGTVLEGREQK